jgi:hypothetical protein
MRKEIKEGYSANVLSRDEIFSLMLFLFFGLLANNIYRSHIARSSRHSSRYPGSEIVGQPSGIDQRRREPHID